MRLSFDDKESFMDVAESLRFDNPPSDPSTLREVGSRDSFPGTFPAIDSTLRYDCVFRSLSLTESLSH